jgi:hypothetical protein
LKNDSDCLSSPTPIEPHTPQRTLIEYQPSQEDRINSLLSCLELYEYKLQREQLQDYGFSDEFIEKCLEKKIIRINPDKTVGIY